MIDGLQRVDAGHSAKLETEHDGFVVLTSVTHVLANQHEIRSESSAERELGKGIKKRKISLGYELFPTEPLFCNRKEKEQIIKRPQDGVEYVYSEGSIIVKLRSNFVLDDSNKEKEDGGKNRRRQRSQLGEKLKRAGDAVMGY